MQTSEFFVDAVLLLQYIPIMVWALFSYSRTFYATSNIREIIKFPPILKYFSIFHHGLLLDVSKLDLRANFVWLQKKLQKKTAFENQTM